MNRNVIEYGGFSNSDSEAMYHDKWPADYCARRKYETGLHEAEEYGDALQHGGHHDFWEKLHPATEAERKLKSHAYDYYPRGRMVCFPKRQTVRLYVEFRLNCFNTIMPYLAEMAEQVMD